ncbi:hypothetical protein [Actinomadura rugatobispora]|uniref:Uncharacterized protein n=1 Tax=Actinomadura rugatobispora TaxID=1994 RepID=A0ABW1AJZ7_9ACTN|nr:hypothetical protein GCM10010200_048730 [Actinomadura rugatobispora]
MTTYGQARLHELVKRLLLATEQSDSNVEWHESDRPNAFHSTLGGATVVIASDDDDGRYPYSLEILDEEGALVDSLKSGTYENDNGEWEMEWNSDLEALYDRARRSVKNVDRVLNEIMKHLPQLPPNTDPWATGSGSFSDDPPF